MGTDWERIVSREVGDNRKIRLPDELVVYFLEGGMDDSVFWNYERNAEYIVLSKRPLSDEEYQPVTRTKIYNENGIRKIRPPGGLSDSLLTKFYEGNELFYLLHSGMIESSTFSMYLLTRREVLDLLPTDTNSNSNSDLKSQIMSTPGFLGSR